MGMTGPKEGNLVVKLTSISKSAEEGKDPLVWEKYRRSSNHDALLGTDFVQSNADQPAAIIVATNQFFLVVETSTAKNKEGGYLTLA